MAAPTAAVTATRVPVGRKMTIGKTTIITIDGTGTSHDDIAFWEQSVTPMGVDGGEKVQIGDMYNVLWKTSVPQKLAEVTDMSARVAYAPEVMASDIQLAINNNTTITIHWPNGDRLAFYGFLKSFTPGEVTMDGQPTATITISATMWDPINFVEAGFTFVSA